MKSLVLRINNESYVPERLEEEAVSLGHELDIANYQELSFKFKGTMTINQKGTELEEYQAVILRAAGTTTGSYIAPRNCLIRHSQEKGIFCLNGQAYLSNPRLDKLTQHYLLEKAGLPVVKTMCFGKHLDLNQVARHLKDEFNGPILAKPRFGSQGKNINLLEKEDDLISKLEKLRSETYQDLVFWLFQRFLKTRRDYRVIAVGNKVVGGMVRTAQDNEIVTNYSQGGEIGKAKLNSQMEDLALKTAKVFNLDYAGVDLMEDENGNYYILEVNRACWFKGFEKATGENVAKK